MTSKANKKVINTSHASDAPRPQNTLNVTESEGKSRERILAELGVCPILGNANTAKMFARGTMGELDLTECVAVFRDEVAKVRKNDLGRVEATLMAQATTLDAIFNELAKRAHANMGEHFHAADTYMRLALKAQGQCRATIETLAEIKNPRPVAFVKQANIANGPQQVNNGSQAGPRARTENSEIQSNRLLEANSGERLDFGTARETVGPNPQLEAVDAFNGAKDTGR